MNIAGEFGTRIFGWYQAVMDYQHTASSIRENTIWGGYYFFKWQIVASYHVNLNFNSQLDSFKYIISKHLNTCDL
jgi:hypothetical protein